jgi:hypothetical protein
MRPIIRHIPPSAGCARDLVGWRRQRLLRAGVDADLAGSIASDSAIDLHAMIELLERGCPPVLAARILAPLDQERSP